MKKLWKNIQIGDTFMDGSKVVSIHDSYDSECYDVHYVEKLYRGLMKPLNRVAHNVNHSILSANHLLLCNISKLNDESKKWVERQFGERISPTKYDLHVYCDNLMDVNNLEEMENAILNPKMEKNEIIQFDPLKVNDSLYWLPVDAIFELVTKCKQRIICNGHDLNVDYAGVNEVFCVETNTHKYETNGLIHHNSVTLRNIIFHCLTHGEQICVALIDLKWTEFTPFKGVKNVVAVANTVKEAAEITRLAREVMYKRNQELAKLGLNDIKNFKPTKPTENVIVAGRKLHDDDQVEIKIDGEIKTVTVKELENYL